MTTSNSTNFTRTAGQLVNKAFRIIGVGRSGEDIEAEEGADGLETLNLMVHSWQGEKIHLWKKKNAILWPVAGRITYALGVGGDRAAVTWAETSLAAAAGSTATALTVGAIAGISASDVLGVVLDDNTMHWTTVSGAPSGTTVTAATGLAGPARAGAKVYAYTAIMARPMRVIDMQRRLNDIDIPMELLSRLDYRVLPNKTSASSTPVTAYYDPQTVQGKLSLWQGPSDEASSFRFTAHMPFEDFDAITDEADFPQEWNLALIYNLAVDLIPSWGSALSQIERQHIVARAEMLKEALRDFDSEPVPLQFVPEPDYSGYR